MISQTEETATWHHVAQRLASSGVREWRRALSDLQAAVDVDHATRLIDVYTDRVGAYGPFALYRRCRNASSSLDPEDGWPDPLAGSQYAAELRAAESQSQRPRSSPVDAAERARFVLIRKGINEARDWSDARCIAAMKEPQGAESR